MARERDVLVSPAAEGPVVDGEVVTAIRTLSGRGLGKKAIARERGVSINSVRRYLRQPVQARHQSRPASRRLTEALAGFGKGAVPRSGRRCRCRPATVRGSRTHRERGHGRARVAEHSARAARRAACVGARLSARRRVELVALAVRQSLSQRAAGRLARVDRGRLRALWWCAADPTRG